MSLLSLFRRPDIMKMRSEMDTAGLHKALAHRDARTRLDAAKALADMVDVSALDALAEGLNDPEDRVRATAASGLSALFMRMRSEKDIPALITALDHRNAEVRVDAAEALGVMVDARAFDALVRALADPEERVRVRAARGLGLLGDGRAKMPLVSALGDPCARVSNQARESLTRLGWTRSCQMCGGPGATRYVEAGVELWFCSETCGGMFGMQFYSGGGAEIHCSQCGKGERLLISAVTLRGAVCAACGGKLLRLAQV